MAVVADCCDPASRRVAPSSKTCGGSAELTARRGLFFGCGSTCLHLGVCQGRGAGDPDADGAELLLEVVELKAGAWSRSCLCSCKGKERRHGPAALNRPSNCQAERGCLPRGSSIAMYGPEATSRRCCGGHAGRVPGCGISIGVVLDPRQTVHVQAPAGAGDGHVGEAAHAVVDGSWDGVPHVVPLVAVSRPGEVVGDCHLGPITSPLGLVRSGDGHLGALLEGESCCRSIYPFRLSMS